MPEGTDVHLGEGREEEREREKQKETVGRRRSKREGGREEENVRI